ncbi:MAG TPA: hypothetical protein GXZ64_00055 [Clostridiaceae bacterium]|nr:hypothetical protein [Clostridiaceae bacterium]
MTCGAACGARVGAGVWTMMGGDVRSGSRTTPGDVISTFVGDVTGAIESDGVPSGKVN